MRLKSILLLGLALGCGAVASIGISQVMERKGTPAATPETEPILVALSDININEPLTAELLKLEEWPKDKIAPDSLRSIEEVVGRRTRTKLYAGEPIREAKLVSADGADAPSEQIAKGYRVVAVRVDAATGVAGLLKPGDRVDVQLFVQKCAQLGIDCASVQTILEDIKVFAVDQSFRRAVEQDDEAAQVARTISLLVTPKQSETLNLANELGKIRLTIRHPDDDTNVATDATTTEDLFVDNKADRERENDSVSAKGKPSIHDFLQNLQAKPQPAPPTEVVALPAENAFVMQIFEGSQAREVEFTADGRLPQEPSSEREAAPAAVAPPVALPATAAPAQNAPALPLESLPEVGGELDELQLGEE